MLKSLSATRAQMEKEASMAAREAYNAKMKEVLSEAKERDLALTADYERRVQILADKMAVEQEKLNNIEAKQLAYIQAQQRQEEIQANRDYYRLSLD